MITFLARAREEFDYVLLDSPPVASITDSLVLAGQVDGTIMIIKASDTARDPIRRGLKQLEEVKAKVLGAVLNQVDLKRERYYYHYYYRYYKSWSDNY